jgi:hypothetical protein
MANVDLRDGRCDEPGRRQPKPIDMPQPAEAGGIELVLAG